MFLELLEPFQVVDIVSKLNPKMSSGFDEIQTKIVTPSVLLPITHIVNRSLLAACVPDEMELGKVIPIFEASDPSLLKNYHSSKHITAFTKVIERIMFNKMMSFLLFENQ